MCPPNQNREDTRVLPYGLTPYASHHSVLEGSAPLRKLSSTAGAPLALCTVCHALPVGADAFVV